MKGLHLAKQYHQNVVVPAFSSRFPDLFSSMAFGLVGAGSECLGFDDNISLDHDWGPKECIWVPEALFCEKGALLQQCYDDLQSSFEGYAVSRRIDVGGNRDGVCSIERFYEQILGSKHLPQTNLHWLVLKDEPLSQCTNGSVFLDNLGAFTAVRRHLLSYYPRDVWLKKLFAHCFKASQYGQYNLVRSEKRKDTLAYSYCKVLFCSEVTSLLFLLNKSYKPFYKWQFKALETLDERAKLIKHMMEDLCRADCERARNCVEAIAASIVAAVWDNPDLGPSLEPYRNQLGKSVFLQDYGFVINTLIEDEYIKTLMGDIE